VGVDERVAALEKLERIGYVDDARVAASRAETLAARGQGDEAIRFDLERRGLSAEHVQAALAALTPERERALEVVERLGRSAKTVAQLRRKGFGAEALEAAFGDGIAGRDV
jgi:SOS response regulatory protein OraA/RecX